MCETSIFKIFFPCLYNFTLPKYRQDPDPEKIFRIRRQVRYGRQVLLPTFPIYWSTQLNYLGTVPTQYLHNLRQEGTDIQVLGEAFLLSLLLYQTHRIQIFFVGSIGTVTIRQFSTDFYLQYRQVPLVRAGLRIRKIFTGSGSYRYFGNVKMYKQGKNVLKQSFYTFSGEFFPFFQIKIR